MTDVKGTVITFMAVFEKGCLRVHNNAWYYAFWYS